MTRYFFFTVILISFAYSQKTDNWELIVDQDELKVYRGKREKNNIYPIRGDYHTPHTPAQVVAVLLDIVNKPKWLPKLAKTRLIKQFDSRRWIEYAEIDVPWPCRNRDIIFELSLDINDDFSKAVFHLKSVLNDTVYKKSNIRAIVYESKMIITYNQQTKKSFIQSESFVDPKGSIPKWIVNLFQKSQTIKIAKALTKQLNKNLYSHISSDKLRLGPF